MRKILREAIAEVERQGATVVGVFEGAKHTELHIEFGGRPGVLRLHRGGKVTHRAERALRSAIRGAVRP